MGFVWETYQTNVLRILEPSKILSVAWQDLDSDTTTVRCIADYPGYTPGLIDDEALVKEVWKILDESDVVCAHYGSKFDLPKLNARFVYYGLNSPSSYHLVDTKKVASKYFKFDSNSLNNLGQYLNVGSKIENGGFDLWVRCIEGDMDAWKMMCDYNAQDVRLLKQVYLKLRPFIANHPDMNSTPSDCTCKACKSTSVTRRGFAFTKTGRKQRFQCNDCGSWFTGQWERTPKNLSTENET